MDVDAFVAAHGESWRRLEWLVKHARSPRRLSGAELDELVDLYQRTATHLSVIRSASPDPRLIARLSSLVIRARSAVTGSRTRSWADAGRFVAVTFPAAVWRVRWWFLATAAGCLAVMFVTGAWVANSESTRLALAPPEHVRAIVETEFEAYYSSQPASSFAAHVFTNNAQVGALAFASGILFGIPTLYVLANNSLNVGVMGGFMVSAGRGDLFFGLILPHGLLELTAVFLAGAIGLRIGWTIVDPGPRSRSDALAEEGRAAVGIVVGLVGVFFVAGLIEAFVTPSGLPTWARVGVGVAAEVAFLTYVLVLGRRAAVAGETGDLIADLRGDRLPAV